MSAFPKRLIALAQNAMRAAQQFRGVSRAGFLTPLITIEKELLKTLPDIEIGIRPTRLPPDLEAAFMRAAFPDQGLDTFNAILSTAMNARNRYLTDSFSAAHDDLNLPGLTVVKLNRVIIPPKSRAPQIGSGKGGFETLSPKPRIQTLLAALNDNGTDLDQLIIYTGHVENYMMREASYAIIIMPNGVQISLNNEVGETSFIATPTAMKSPLEWTIWGKDELKAREDITHLDDRSGSPTIWTAEMVKIINQAGTGLLIKGPTTIKRLQKDARAKSAPLTEDVIWHDILDELGRCPEHDKQFVYAKSGSVQNDPDDTWSARSVAMQKGGRGLHRSISLPNFIKERIHEEAKRYREKHGINPDSKSGSFMGRTDVTWGDIAKALKNNTSHSTTLARVVLNNNGETTEDQIWLDILSTLAACAEGNKQFVHSKTDSPPPHDPDDTWSAINAALGIGSRALPGNNSLAKLIKGRVRQAALIYKQEYGQDPGINSGPYLGRPDITWSDIDQAFRNNPATANRTTLARVIAGDNGSLTEDQIWKDILEDLAACPDDKKRFPNVNNGSVLNDLDDTWSARNTALMNGLRGLPGGASLSKFIKDRIYQAAQQYQEQYGQAVNLNSGLFMRRTDITWFHIDQALRNNGPRSTTLAKLIANDDSTLTESQIWSDVLDELAACPEGAKRFVTNHSGPVLNDPDDTWQNRSAALDKGNRGLPGGSSVAKLIKDYILEAATAYKQKYGVDPDVNSGLFSDCSNITWAHVDEALRNNLARSTTLAKLISGDDGKLTEDQIWHDILDELAACDETNRGFVNQDSGPVLNDPHDNWQSRNVALLQGLRGLPGGSSLFRLMQSYVRQAAKVYKDEYGHDPDINSGPFMGRTDVTWGHIDQALRNNSSRSTTLAKLIANDDGTLTQDGIWADILDELAACPEGEKRFVTNKSGPVLNDPDDTWSARNLALINGGRGLVKGLSISRLIKDRVRKAALLYKQEYGHDPDINSGPFLGRPNITWAYIDQAFRNHPNLATRTTLFKFIAGNDGKLTEDQIWADVLDELASCPEGGKRFPNVKSGAVRNDPDNSWATRNSALDAGVRGLPGNSSLFQLIKDRIRQAGEAYKQKYGVDPDINSGQFMDRTDITWAHIGQALGNNPSAPKRTTIAKVIAKDDGILTEDQIWADMLRALATCPNGEKRFPNPTSGSVHSDPDDNWQSRQQALRTGARGLAGGSSLFQLMKERLCQAAIMYRQEHGRNPDINSGPFMGRTDVTWEHIDQALRNNAGHTTTLRRVITNDDHKLTEDQIWTDILDELAACTEGDKRFPSKGSGPVRNDPEDTWNARNKSLMKGRRGLPGGNSLSTLIKDRVCQATLAYKEQYGHEPDMNSGPFAGRADITWADISQAMKHLITRRRAVAIVPANQNEPLLNMDEQRDITTGKNKLDLG